MKGHVIFVSWNIGLFTSLYPDALLEILRNWLAEVKFKRKYVYLLFATPYLWQFKENAHKNMCKKTYRGKQQTEPERLLLETVTLMNGNTKTTRSFIETESYEYGNHVLKNGSNSFVLNYCTMNHLFLSNISSPHCNLCKYII